MPQQSQQHLLHKIGSAFVLLADAAFLYYYFCYRSVKPHRTGIAFELVLCVLIIPALTIFRGKIEQKLRALKAFRLLQILMTLFGFAVAYIVADATVSNMDGKRQLFYQSRTPDAVALNFVIIFLLFLVFLLLTASLSVASVLTVLTGTILSVANYFVFTMRGVPLLATDLFSLGTAVNVADEYHFDLSLTVLAMAEGAFLYLVLFRCFGSCRIAKGKKRVLLSAAILCVLLISGKVLIFSDFLEPYYITMVKPLRTYRKNGTYLTFLRSAQYIHIETPDGYSVEKIEALAEEYPSDEAPTGDNDSSDEKTSSGENSSSNGETSSAKNAASNGETTSVEKTTSDSEMPNVIVIIDEAFSDLAAITPDGDLNTNEDYMPFFHSLTENTIRGISYSSVLGGGTANTEFEVLTGNSTLLLPENAVAFQLYVKSAMPSLASLYDELGYQGITAIHPYYKNGYNRTVVYPLLGFHEFLGKDDFPSDARMVRGYISDYAVMDMIIEKYETAKESSDTPFFIYSMTMQNHGSYDNDFDNLQTTISLNKYPEQRYTTHYLNLLRHTDEALEQLITYFEKVDEPTVILFTGDHQPNLTKEYLKQLTEGESDSWTDEDAMKRYAVPFVIWANYDIEEKTYEKTSMNYLQSILFDLCGLPMTGYQKYLLHLSEDIPAITANGYWGADGTFYALEDTSSPYYEELLEYEAILYNNISDTSHRVDEFYNLK